MTPAVMMLQSPRVHRTEHLFAWTELSSFLVGSTGRLHSVLVPQGFVSIMDVLDAMVHTFNPRLGRLGQWRLTGATQ